MLFALLEAHEDGQIWNGEMIGVDYSESSVLLARRIISQTLGICLEKGSNQAPDSETGSQQHQIQFELWDILSQQPGDWLREGFDVVLDKGTFDAISLMPRSEGNPHPCQIYREKVTNLIKPGCFLFVTSCNWTKDELTSWLAIDGGELSFFEEGKYPKFTFGGRTGQSVVTCVFHRRGI